MTLLYYTGLDYRISLQDFACPPAGPMIPAFLSHNGFNHTWLLLRSLKTFPEPQFLMTVHQRAGEKAPGIAPRAWHFIIKPGSLNTCHFVLMFLLPLLAFSPDMDKLDWWLSKLAL